MNKKQKQKLLFPPEDYRKYNLKNNTLCSYFLVGGIICKNIYLVCVEMQQSEGDNYLDEQKTI